MLLQFFAAVLSEPPIIGGWGDWKYQYMPDLLALPLGAEVQDAHGLELDAAGNIYLEYRNWNDGIVSNGTDRNCLIRWAPDGTNGTFLTAGGDALCTGKPHGIKVASENGVEYLYHVNVETGSTASPGQTARNSGKLTKTTLEGDIIWQLNGTAWLGAPLSASTVYRPSWWSVNQPGPFIYLTDGYGSFNVYVFTRDGAFVNRTFGGRGTAHGVFDNPHGITYDHRARRLAVSDRLNGRIEFFDFDAARGGTFAYAATVDAASLNASARLPGFKPCNFRPIAPDVADPALQGAAVVAALEGVVAVLDRGNALVSVVDVAGLIGQAGSTHPHDAIFLRNGDIVVGTWDWGYVSYWKRLAPGSGSRSGSGSG